MSSALAAMLMQAVTVPGGGNHPSTVLLLPFQGADGSTTVTDISPAGTVVTANGTAQLDAAQFKFRGSSLLLDGDSDYLTHASGTNFVFGTGDFTIDFWFRLSALAVNPIFVDWRTAAGASVTPVIYVDAGTGQLVWFVNGSPRISGGAHTTGVWYHAAVARSGASTRLFSNGMQVGSTYTDSNNYTAGTTCYWGRSAQASANFVSGWMAEIRVIKGFAAWTANFTPPGRPYT
jgi:hypothetical protein